MVIDHTVIRLLLDATGKPNHSLPWRLLANTAGLPPVARCAAHSKVFRQAGSKNNCYVTDGHRGLHRGSHSLGRSFAVLAVPVNFVLPAFDDTVASYIQARRVRRRNLH